MAVIGYGHSTWGDQLRRRAVVAIHTQMKGNHELLENQYIPYLAFNMFDRVASRDDIETQDTIDQDLDLVIRGCLRLAVKFQHASLEDVTESSNLSGTEEFVFNDLQPRLNPVTPLSYLDFLVKNQLRGYKALKGWEVDTDELIQKAKTCISVVSFSIKVMSHRPSVVAINAVLAQLNNRNDYDDLRALIMKGFEHLEDEVEYCKSKILFV